MNRIFTAFLLMIALVLQGRVFVSAADGDRGSCCVVNAGSASACPICPINASSTKDCCGKITLVPVSMIPAKVDTFAFSLPVSSFVSEEFQFNSLPQRPPVPPPKGV